MAPPNRLIPSVPTRIETTPSEPPPRGNLLAALLTLLTLAPVGAVLGYVMALNTGQDGVLFTLVGALGGAVVSWWKSKS